MDAPNIYTITIIRNFGSPISFTIRRWKAQLFLAAFLALASYAAWEVFLHWRLKEESRELRKELSDSKKKIGMLTAQIAKYDNALYQGQGETNSFALEETLTEQPAVKSEGVWITNRRNLLTQDIPEEKELEIANFSPHLRGDDLHISIRVANTSQGAKDIGGYINITLVNNDQSPPIYKSATGGSLGNNGFPSTYKSGRQFQINKRRKTRTVRIKPFRLTDADEYYTDALLLVHSYKGRLLFKRTMPLDRGIFLEQ